MRAGNSTDFICRTTAKPELSSEGGAFCGFWNCKEHTCRSVRRWRGFHHHGDRHFRRPRRRFARRYGSHDDSGRRIRHAGRWVRDWEHHHRWRSCQFHRVQHLIASTKNNKQRIPAIAPERARSDGIRYLLGRGFIVGENFIFINKKYHDQ